MHAKAYLPKYKKAYPASYVLLLFHFLLLFIKTIYLFYFFSLFVSLICLGENLISFYLYNSKYTLLGIFTNSINSIIYSWPYLKPIELATCFYIVVVDTSFNIYIFLKNKNVFQGGHSLYFHAEPSSLLLSYLQSSAWSC